MSRFWNADHRCRGPARVRPESGQDAVRDHATTNHMLLLRESMRPASSSGTAARPSWPLCRCFSHEPPPTRWRLKWTHARRKPYHSPRRDYRLENMWQLSPALFFRKGSRRVETISKSGSVGHADRTNNAIAPKMISVTGLLFFE